MLFFTTISFVIFKADGLNESIENLKGMLGILNIPFSNNETVYYFRSYAFVLIIAAIGATPLVKRIIERLKNHKEARKIINMVEPVMLILLLLLVTAYLVDGSFNPFLYFRF